MLQVASGEELHIPDLIIGDVSYVPDAGNVNIIVKDTLGGETHNGSVSFDAKLSVPQGVLLVSSTPLRFFSITITFQCEGVTRVYRDIIRAHTDYMLIYGPQDVRNMLGVSREELPDTDVDLYLSLSDLYDEFQTDFYNIDIMQSNRLVLYKECLRQCPSLGLKALQKNEADDIRKTRFANVNIKALREDIENRYNALRSSLSIGDPIPVDPILSFVTRTDPFTGGDA